MLREATTRHGVVITGASRGLGEALALQYARPGVDLGLLGRDEVRLEQVAAACRDRGADVTTGVVDVTNDVEVTRWFERFDAAAPIELVIVNAGLFNGHGAETRETVPEMLEVVRTNLEGAILTINAVLPMFCRRRRGQIAIIGSLAALHPLADAPAYSASKAGIMAYGEALREWLIPYSVDVSLIYPGHIRTQQVAHHIGQLPMIVSPERAAAIIKSGLDRRRGFIVFPMRLYWLIILGRLVPWRLRAWFGADMRFHVAKG